MSHTFPLVFWGSVDDLSTWSQTGTCGITASQTDPLGGSTAVALTDNDAGTAEARYKEYTATYSGYHHLTVAVAPSTGTQVSAVKFENVTLATPGTANLSWASYVLTQSTSGIGVQSAVNIANSYAVIRIRQYATAGNTMRITLYPAGTTASDTGTMKVYLRNLCLLDVLDQPVAWEEPREGSVWVQGASGVEDAWIQGTDYRFGGTVQWVPKVDRDAPASVSGWGLPNERVGINCGVAALLRAGRQKDALTFYADRTALDSYYATTCTLVDPMRGAPEVLPNGDRRFRLELRGTSNPFQALETE